MSSTKHVGAGLLAGAIAGLVMTVVMLILASIFNIATPLVILGDRLSVLFTPETFFWLMGRVGGYNHMKQLGVGSAMFGQIVVGAIGGAVYASRAPRLSLAGRRKFSLGVFVLFPLVVATAVLWSVLGTHYSGYPIAIATVLTLLGLLISFFAFERTLVLSYEGLTSRPHSVPANFEYSPPVARRAFLLGGLGLLVAGGGAAILRKLYSVATFSYDGTQYFGETVQAVTPNEQFYTVTKNVIDPVVDETVWRLEVTGQVDRPQHFDFDALKKLPSLKQETTIMCISNGLDAGLMSNAVWTGVTMRSLLETAGPRVDVSRVRLHGVDNYTDTIPMEKALDPATLVVYEMNGAPLPQRHGFPARAIVPGYFGEKHVKWITRIELADENAKGFYEAQGWGPDFTVPTRSRIDVPYNFAWVDLATASNGINVRGVAFGGNHGVSRVEISSDDGNNWTEARIDYPGTRLTWALWSYDWRPAAAGNYSLVVRATNGDGQLQFFDSNRSFKSGITGFHKIAVYIG